jgi:uncharacterized protein
MKKTIFVVAALCIAALGVAAQEKMERRVIEVSGSAERLITPDEFTFRITLIERLENKQKVTIDQQETALRNELTKLGIDAAKDLSIYDISSTYFRQKKIKDVLGSKDYRLKIRDLIKIAQLQDIADRLNLGKLDLIDTDNSEMTRHRREVKIEAIRAARAKAEYLLAAIGERIGKPVLIQEIEEETPGLSNRYLANSTSNSIARVSAGVVDSSDSSLSFTQTKLRFVIVAKFEIE